MNACELGIANALERQVISLRKGNQSHNFY